MGNLNDLKQFGEMSLKLHGKSSPGGYVKQENLSSSGRYYSVENCLDSFPSTEASSVSVNCDITALNDSERDVLKSMLQSFVCEDSYAEDEVLEGDMASHTCLFMKSCLQNIRIYLWVI